MSLISISINLFRHLKFRYALQLPFMQYISQTISLANWDVIHIGGRFSLVNREILNVYCFMTLYNTCNHKQCWHTLNLRSKPKSPNRQIKITTKCTVYTVIGYVYIIITFLTLSLACMVNPALVANANNNSCILVMVDQLCKSTSK